MRSATLFGVKAVHSLIFLALQTAIGYLLFTGLKGRSDRSALVAAAAVGAECAIYVGNGFRCPLTGVAERLGSAHGAVTDIFLPRWLAFNIDKIYGPLFAVGLLLHTRNLLHRREMLSEGDRL